MKRIDHATAVDGQFTGGNPSAGIPPTVVTAAWLNGVQEEMCRLIEAQGITLDPGDQDQLAAAILAMIVGELAALAIADISGLQTALDGKLPLGGGTLTGALTVGADTSTHKPIYLCGSDGGWLQLKFGANYGVAIHASASGQGRLLAYNGSSWVSVLQWKSDGTLTVNGSTAWHAGNDGAGSGLDADLLDGMQPATTNTASTIVQRDASGNFNAATITANLFNGTATSARYA